MNKNKFSIKTLIVIVILILVGVLGVLGINTAKTYLSGASGDTVAKNVLAKPNEDGKSVTITWSTDKPSMGVVEYGTTPASLLLRAPESEQTASHSIVLSPLKSNTNYYFRIKVGEDVFDNNGIPYSFKSKGSTGSATPTVMIKPTVALVPTVASGTPVVGGACNRTTDYNKDGVVNSLDYMSCLKTRPTGSVVITPSSVPTKATTEVCPANVDYNKDGVINTMDKIKCLSDRNK
ncbi:MAG: fibronectin type III domain-containing protein [Candidatus Shapirobacteria bacterium]